MVHMDRNGGRDSDIPAPPPQPGFGPPPAAYAPQQPHPGYAAPQPHPAYAAPQQQSYPGYGPPQPQYGAPQPPAGPDFLATDRRNAVVVDAAGVSFEANGATADFAWHQIHTVHHKAGNHGYALMVAVVLPDGRFYECVVNARSRSKLQQWLAQLGPVLAMYLARSGR
ncbi:hypothetical protein [Streptomyces sp. NPDC058280]|uniref:hypothetical protein n=1 Tax=Streptomyces sp. NPDC058280 TaxID=3346419 RepID=UPI0036EDC58E